DVGAQGVSPAPGALLPRTLGTPVDGTAGTLTATTTASGGDATRLDALMLQPLVTRLVLGGDDHGTALLRSVASATRTAEVDLPGTGTADVWSYDGSGRLVRHTTSTAARVPATVVPGGFTLVRR
ncbi:MAG: hypothetical protein HOQ22_17600, partial [Nocardioidaceae bacterium]|nr:hypothetical protein [Nocardioidaceae bacterium]